MRTVATILALIAMLVVGIGPVAADTTGGGNGTSATAFQDGGCTENGDGTVTCSGTQLDAFKDNVSGELRLLRRVHVHIRRRHRGSAFKF